MIYRLLVAAAILQSTRACLSSGVCGGAPSCAPHVPAPTCAPATCQPGYSCGPYGCARNRARSALTQKVDGIFISDESEIPLPAPPTEETANNGKGEARVIHRNVFGMKRTFKESSGEAKTVGEQSTPHIDNTTIDLLMNPNYLFRQCCEERKLPDNCLSKCNYNSYTKDALQNMYLKVDGCPLEAAADMQFCAAQGRDHRECCARNGVATTLAGEKCLTFCDQTPNRVTKLDYSYVPCYDRFENIKRCFYNEVKEKAEKQFGKYRRRA